MKPKWLWLVMIVAAVMAYGGLFMALAQEATPDGFSALAESTPETPGVNVTVEHNGDVTVEVDSQQPTGAPDGQAVWSLLGTMSGGVVYLLEVIKNSGLKQALQTANPLVYAATNLALSAFLSAFLILGASEAIGYPVTIFTAAEFAVPINPTWATVITAFSMAFGSTFLHAGYDYLRTARGVVIQTNDPNTARAAAQAVKRF